MKSRLNAGQRPGLYFLRDSNGNEVDLVIEQGIKLTPVEIKSGQTVARDFFAGMRKWMELCGDQAVNPVLIYSGE